MSVNRSNLLVRAVGAISSRPRLVLCASVMVAGLATWRTTRIHPATSITSMLATDDPASKALAQVADRFATGDELIVLATLPSAVNRSEGRSHAPTSDELRSAIRAKLSAHKVPRMIEFRDKLPRSPTGKILRRIT